MQLLSWKMMVTRVVKVSLIIWNFYNSNGHHVRVSHFNTVYRLKVYFSNRCCLLSLHILLSSGTLLYPQRMAAHCMFTLATLWERGESDYFGNIMGDSDYVGNTMGESDYVGNIFGRVRLRWQHYWRFTLHWQPYGRFKLHWQHRGRVRLRWQHYGRVRLFGPHYGRVGLRWQHCGRVRLRWQHYEWVGDRRMRSFSSTRAAEYCTYPILPIRKWNLF